MAVRRTILQIGSSELGGNRPASEIVSSGGSTATQTTFAIWNGSAWADLQPGVNSNPAIGDDRWGPEIMYRGAMATPAEKLYLIKYCVTSTMTPIASADSWSPALTGQAWSDLIAWVTAAAAAANVAGDTIRIDGIVLSICASEMVQAMGARTYANAMLDLIIRLRAALVSIPHCAVGTFRDDAGVTPAVIIEPHYKWTSIDDAVIGGIAVRRCGLQGLDSQEHRIRVYRTHHLTHDGGGVHFSGASLVTMGQEIPSYFQAPAAVSLDGLPTARVVVMIGDSIIEGSSANSALPPQQVGAMSGCYIWSPKRGAFETLQAGTNNQISVPAILNAHGPEMTLAELHRGAEGEVRIVKASAWGTFATRYYEPTLPGLAPTFDPYVNDWAPASRNDLFDLHIRGHLRSALAQIIRDGKRPVAGPVYICLGNNDVLLGYRAFPAEAADTLRTLCNAVKNEMFLAGAKIDEIKFVLSMPSTGLADAETVSGDDLATVRSGIQELADSDSRVMTVDLTEFPTSDGLHPSAVGTAQYARAMYAAWASGIDASTVQPLFVPSMTELRKGLRLSQVPDSNDAVTMIENAVAEVRVQFYRSLGSAKIATIQGYASVKTPVQDNELIRKMAETAETKAVRLALMRTLPTMFLDGASQLQTWNEEAAFRAANDKVLRDEIKRLESEVASLLDELNALQLTAGTGSPGALVAPDNTIAPGDTIFFRSI